MDVREAVSIAREYISDVYAEEEIQGIGLEEIRFDDAGNIWRVTIGFFRSWDRDVLLWRKACASSRDQAQLIKEGEHLRSCKLMTRAVVSWPDPSRPEIADGGRRAVMRLRSRMPVNRRYSEFRIRGRGERSSR